MRSPELRADSSDLGKGAHALPLLRIGGRPGFHARLCLRDFLDMLGSLLGNRFPILPAAHLNDIVAVDALLDALFLGLLQLKYLKRQTMIGIIQLIIITQKRVVDIKYHLVIADDHGSAPSRVSNLLLCPSLLAPL